MVTKEMPPFSRLIRDFSLQCFFHSLVYKGGGATEWIASLVTSNCKKSSMARRAYTKGLAVLGCVGGPPEFPREYAGWNVFTLRMLYDVELATHDLWQSPDFKPGSRDPQFIYSFLELPLGVRRFNLE
jgi:hypothetical protein